VLLGLLLEPVSKTKPNAIFNKGKIKAFLKIIRLFYRQLKMNIEVKIH
jgi:hypothetical protein